MWVLMNSKKPSLYLPVLPVDVVGDQVRLMDEDSGAVTAVNLSFPTAIVFKKSGVWVLVRRLGTEFKTYNSLQLLN